MMTPKSNVIEFHRRPVATSRRAKRCWFFHEWGMWSEPEIYAYSAYQHRACLRCGLSRQRKIPGWWWTRDNMGDGE